MTLFVTGIFANHHDIAVTTNDFALVAHGLNTGANLHIFSLSIAGLVPQWFLGPFLIQCLLVTVDNAATCQVVRT